MRLWRISNYADLDGQGGLFVDGRWHSRGRPIVYLAEHSALALTEVLVHFDLAPDDLPDRYQLIEVECSGSIDECPELPADWSRDQPLTQSIGDQWLENVSALMLRVPSAVVPKSYNYLFNPLHSEAGQARIIAVASYPFDERLLC